MNRRGILKWRNRNWDNCGQKKKEERGKNLCEFK
jgi:hypothetical protein